MRLNQVCMNKSVRKNRFAEMSRTTINNQCQWRKLQYPGPETGSGFCGRCPNSIVSRLEKEQHYKMYCECYNQQ